VTQEFAKLDWDVTSVDVDNTSNATKKISIEWYLEELERDESIAFDMLWASPPCTTFSCLAANIHRGKNKPKSDLAYQHDVLLEILFKIINLLKVRLRQKL
jgi:site-specific DNA-cytosine methylase